MEGQALDRTSEPFTPALESQLSRPQLDGSASQLAGGGEGAQLSITGTYSAAVLETSPSQDPQEQIVHGPAAACPEPDQCEGGTPSQGLSPPADDPPAVEPPHAPSPTEDKAPGEGLLAAQGLGPPAVESGRGPLTAGPTTAQDLGPPAVNSCKPPLPAQGSDPHAAGAALEPLVPLLPPGLSPPDASSRCASPAILATVLACI